MSAFQLSYHPVLRVADRVAVRALQLGLAHGITAWKIKDTAALDMQKDTAELFEVSRELPEIGAV